MSSASFEQKSFLQSLSQLWIYQIYLSNSFLAFVSGHAAICDWVARCATCLLHSIQGRLCECEPDLREIFKMQAYLRQSCHLDSFWFYNDNCFNIIFTKLKAFWLSVSSAFNFFRFVELIGSFSRTESNTSVSRVMFNFIISTIVFRRTSLVHVSFLHRALHLKADFSFGNDEFSTATLVASATFAVNGFLWNNTFLHRSWK